MIATRWVGWASLGAVVAGAVAVAAVRMRSSHVEDESWRELTYRVFAVGDGCRGSRHQDAAIRRAADEEAVETCLDAWGGKMAVRTDPAWPSTEEVIMVDEASPLAECLQLRDRNRFCSAATRWVRPPIDAVFHVPRHAGSSRRRTFDEFAWQRELEASGLAYGTIVKMSCPSTTLAPTYVGLESAQLARELSACGPMKRGWFDLALDDSGAVTRVITTPDQMSGVPCVIETACGLRFAGLGSALRIYY